MSIAIKVLHYMTVEQAARELNAYLLGSRNRTNDDRADDALGPYWQPQSSKWQLDDTNDY